MNKSVIWSVTDPLRNNFVFNFINTIYSCNIVSGFRDFEIEKGESMNGGRFVDY